MINEYQAHRFCKDDISKIENYEKAKADTIQTWDLHHRLELTLDGEFAHSKEELKRLGMYYHRPYFELIFLPRAEHVRLHMKGKSFNDEHRQKLSEAKKGKARTAETKRKISESKKGKHHSEETRKKMSESRKGKKRRPFSEESRKKMSEAAKAAWARRRLLNIQMMDINTDI